MALYAIGDLHLGLSVNKPMDVFGPGWGNPPDRAVCLPTEINRQIQEELSCLLKCPNITRLIFPCRSL